MNRTLIAPAGFVLGDGTTAGAIARERWRRGRWIAGFVAILLGVLAIALLTRAGGDSTPLGVDNATPSGARALVQIMRDRGVSVVQTTELERSAELLGPGDTLVIAGVVYPLDSEQAESIADYTGNVVWIEPDYVHVLEFTGDLSFDTAGSDEVRLPGCEAPAALKAERITSRELRAFSLSEGSAGIDLCFGDASEPATGSYAWIDDGTRQVHFFGDGGVLTNGRLADEGNAALAINAIASTDRVIWYVGGPLDDTVLRTRGEGRASDYLEPIAPRWMTNAALALLLAAVVAALWKGRRLGKIIAEPLPVLVRAAETTLGRAKLYRDANARGHASAALRAGLISRVARRIGIPSTADARTVIPAIATAARLPADQVEALLYGPPPATDQQMIHLVHDLDALERKVEQL